MKSIPNKFYLPEEKLPTAWYNLRADMPGIDPMIHPGTGESLDAASLSGIFAEELCRQETDDGTRYFDIPGEVMDYYRTYRPSPLCRAYNLERMLRTPAKIYYKFEGGNTSGSHKLNSAAAMAYYAKKQGLRGLSTETGAGQWGSALSMACAFFGLDLKVYMVKVSAEQKPYRKAVMETYGASVTPSPSNTTAVGRSILARHPDTGGSLGCAISEAVEYASEREGYRYALGSVLNQVVLHQSVIGLETKTAMELLDEHPDVVIGCAGGGSNLGGLVAGYMRDRLAKKSSPRFVAVEPQSCPSLTRGKYTYDYGDTGGVTPLIKMYTLGCGYMPPPEHSGGLRYHGMSPIVSRLYHDGFIDEAIAVPQSRIFSAAIDFAKAETILPAPESAHAICAAMDEAVRCRESGEGKTILFGLTGVGSFDLAAYDAYRSGRIADHDPSEEALERGLATIPKVAASRAG